MNGFDKDFFKSQDYKMKMTCLITGIFMIVLGCYFVIPYFGTFGILWTGVSILYTCIIFIRIVTKATDVDNVSADIKQKEEMNKQIEGEKLDIDLYENFKEEPEISDDKSYKLFRLSNSFTRGRISEKEYKNKKNEIDNDDEKNEYGEKR